MVGFQRNYFWLAILLFGIEVFIAVFVHDAFIRPYVGDFLAVIFLYCLLKSWWRASAGVVGVGALLLAYLVEAAQYMHVVAWLGLQQSRVARVVLGTHFEWIDMLAYTLGALVVVGVDRYRPRPGSSGPVK